MVIARGGREPARPDPGEPRRASDLGPGFQPTEVRLPPAELDQRSVEPAVPIDDDEPVIVDLIFVEHSEAMLACTRSGCGSPSRNLAVSMA